MKLKWRIIWCHRTPETLIETQIYKTENTNYFFQKRNKTCYGWKWRVFDKRNVRVQKRKILAAFSQVKNVATETWYTSFSCHNVFRSTNAGAKHLTTRADYENREFHPHFTVLWIIQNNTMESEMSIFSMVFTFRMTPFLWKTNLCALYTARLNLRTRLSGNRARMRWPIMLLARFPVNLLRIFDRALYNAQTLDWRISGAIGKVNIVVKAYSFYNGTYYLYYSLKTRNLTQLGVFFRTLICPSLSQTVESTASLLGYINAWNIIQTSLSCIEKKQMLVLFSQPCA